MQNIKSDKSVGNTSMLANRSTTTTTTVNGSRMISSCYVMPLFDNAIVDHELSVVGRSITCENHREFNQKLEFHYDYCFSNQHEFAKSAYTFNLAPLVRDALRGESNMIIFGGVQSMNINKFLLSQTVMQGLISQAAGQLLNAVNLTEEKMGSVTFSWYKLDCGSPEILTDVLKAASTQTAGNPSSKSSNDTNSGLILREAGKSRGMYVPGLWEVEIANGAEIETVINHVLDAIPNIADHSIGTSHTIMQLNVVNKLMSSGPPSPGSTVEEQPATGRITFLLLSNLSPSDQQYLSPKNTIPSDVSSQWFPWVEQLFSILQWLESRRASPPFHKSRLLLILREVLLRRQRASLVLLVHPSADQHQVNVQWLKLFAFLSKDLAPTVVSFTNQNRPIAASSSDSHPSTIKRTPSAQRLRSDSSASIHSASQANTGRKSVDVKRSTTPTAGLSRSNSAKRGSLVVNTVPSQQEQTEEDDYQSRFHQSMDQSPLPARSIPEPMLTSIPVSTKNLAANGNNNSFANTAARSSNDGFSGNSYVDDFNNKETEAALVVALEASRNEAAALKIAYNYANDKYNEVKAAYDKLIGQLKEEGSMLEKRDKERFKNALKDLKDYEIYKEVMETAMLRLQTELEALAKENQELRATKAYEEKQIQKQRNFSERYSKDLVATKKRLAEIETKYLQLEKQNKQLTREKEAAVASLAQAQGSQIQKVSQWQETASIRQREVDDLQKKLKIMEDRCKTLEMEKDSILSANAEEVNKLRTAHSKALETVMGYQEENDVLRSAVMEMSSKNNTSVQNSRNNSIVPTNPVRDDPPAPPQNSQSLSPPPAPQDTGHSTTAVQSTEGDGPGNHRMTASNLINTLLNNPPSALAQKRNPVRSTTNMI